jgi:hypothetical protein
MGGEKEGGRKTGRVELNQQDKESVYMWSRSNGTISVDFVDDVDASEGGGQEEAEAGGGI